MAHVMDQEKNLGISVLILTKNEEQNIGNCIASIRWCDDIIVLDSYSNDSTEELAINLGARVIKRKFDDYARQRNYGINDIDYQHSWLLMIDADEEVTDELYREMISVLKNPDDNIVLYRMRRKDLFLGKWIKRSSGYPTWFGRLMKRGKVRVERAINEEYHADGEAGMLKEHLIHHPLNKGFYSWFERHNLYSSMEAVEIMNKNKEEVRLKLLFDSDPTVRRKSLKKLVYSMPGRPFIVFFALYIVRGGFLDGRAGLTFCLLKMFYEYMIDCKVNELGRRKLGQVI